MRKLGKLTKNVRFNLYISPLVNQKPKYSEGNSSSQATIDDSEEVVELFSISKEGIQEKLKIEQLTQELYVLILKAMEDKLADTKTSSLDRFLARRIGAFAERHLRKNIKRMNEMNAVLEILNVLDSELSVYMEAVSKKTVKE